MGFYRRLAEMGSNILLQEMVLRTNYNHDYGTVELVYQDMTTEVVTATSMVETTVVVVDGSGLFLQ